MWPTIYCVIVTKCLYNVVVRIHNYTHNNISFFSCSGHLLWPDIATKYWSHILSSEICIIWHSVLGVTMTWRDWWRSRYGDQCAVNNCIISVPTAHICILYRWMYIYTFLLNLTTHTSGIMDTYCSKIKTNYFCDHDMVYAIYYIVVYMVYMVYMA